jgi:hypothetical protein
MSELDKIARQIKAAKKEYETARANLSKAELQRALAFKAVNDRAKALDELRVKLARTAEGGEPNYSLYV